MKKVYQAPALYAEEFRLAEHISSGCTILTNFGSHCPIVEGGVTFFQDTENSGCDTDSFDLIAGAGGNPKTATIADLINLNYQCYNSFADFNKLFVS